jgi:hypothetical protein
LFKETVAVYAVNGARHTNTLSGQNTGFRYIKTGGKYSNHWTLKRLATCSNFQRLKLKTGA